MLIYNKSIYVFGEIKCYITVQNQINVWSKSDKKIYPLSNLELVELNTEEA